MTDAEWRVILGIFVMILSILLWRITHSSFGWLFLFTNGSYLVTTGVIRILKEPK